MPCRGCGGGPAGICCVRDWTSDRKTGGGSSIWRVMYVFVCNRLKFDYCVFTALFLPFHTI